MDKRQFLAAGIGIGAEIVAQSAFAQVKKGTDELGRGLEAPPPRKIPARKAKTTPLFLTPAGWPNCIAVDPANAATIRVSDAKVTNRRRGVFPVPQTFCIRTPPTIASPIVGK